MAADIVYSVDPQQVIAALKQMNTAQEAWEKGAADANEQVNKAFKNSSNLLLRVNDKTRNSIEQITKAAAKQADTYRMPEIDRLIVQRDKLIGRLNGERAAIDSVTASYSKMIQRAKEAQEAEAKTRGGEGGSPGLLALRGARDLFEGRTSYGEIQIGKSLAALQGAPLIIGATAAALAGLAIAGHSAAKSLAEEAVEIRNVELRTGFTAKEVSQFGFAAEVTGQKVDVFERMMRGLAQATEEQSAAGDKARGWLLKFGVDLRGVRDGTVSTATVFQQISEGLNKLPLGVERGAAALDLFKRAGIETIPVMMGLAENVRIARENGWGPDESDVSKAVAMNTQLKAFDKTLEDIKRNAKEGIVIELKFVGDSLGSAFKWASDLIDKIPGLAVTGDLAQEAREKSLANDIRTANSAKFGNNPLTGAADLTRKRLEALKGLDPSIAYEQSVSGDAGAKLARAAEYQRQIDQLQKDAVEADKQRTAEARKRDDLAVSAYEKSLGLEQKLKSDEAALGKLRAPEIGISTAKEVADYKALQGRIEADKDAIKLQSQQKEYLKTLDSEHRSAGDSELSQLDRINAKYDERISKLKELGIVGKVAADYTKQENADRLNEINLYNEKLDKQLAKEKLAIQSQSERAMLELKQQANPVTSLRELGHGGVTTADVERDIRAQYEQRIKNAEDTRNLIGNQDRTQLQNSGDIRSYLTDSMKADAEQQKQNYAAQIERDKQTNELHQKDRDETRRFNEEMAKIQEGDRAGDIKHSADLAAHVAEIKNHGQDPTRGIQNEYAIRREESQKLYDLDVSRINDLAKVEGENYAVQIDRAKALMDLHQRDDQAREQAELKLLELQHKQLDEIKSAVEPLFNTLLNKPQDFGKQLASTVKEAALKPISSGLADVTSKFLYPTIFGKDGSGGIAGSMRGLFGSGGGKLNDARLLSDGSLAVTVVNHEQVRSGTAGSALGGFGGFSSGTSGGGGTGPAGNFTRAPFSGIAGGNFSLPSLIGGNDGAALPAFSGGGRSDYSIVSGYTGGGSSQGSAGSDLFNLPTNHSSLLSLFGAGGSIIGGGPGGTPGFAPGSLGLGDGGGNGISGGGPAGVSGKQGGSGIGGIIGNASGILKNLKGGLGGFTRTSNGDMAGGNGVDSNSGGGKITGVNGLAGAALMTGGTMLAEQGLLGSSRGTWGGVAEGAVGGAAIGFKLGGPIGAAIGGGVGLGIGLGEKIAGVESPENEAKRLVKQMYRVSIDTAMAKQIVSIAQSKYGSKVSIAVRDPQVRQMIELYAAGTGQKSPLDSSTPRAASLAEQNGQLYQTATSQFGVQNTYQSNLPVLGSSSGNWPTPSGNGVSPMQVSLHISGQDAAGFMSGSYVTPQFVADQNASAMGSSYGRTQNSATLQQPGLITS